MYQYIYIYKHNICMRRCIIGIGSHDYGDHDVPGSTVDKLGTQEGV